MTDHDPGEDVQLPSASQPAKELPKVSDPDDLFMCRVCRGNDGNLFYPCLCTGSIKYVHQECLVEWLKYSKKDVCELCNHKYSFQPIYRPDMPKNLPITEVVKGLVVTSLTMLNTWFNYTVVMGAWLIIVPITAARIYNCIFYAPFSDIFAIPNYMIRRDSIVPDVMKGGTLLAVFISTFISLVWLRDQIISNGPQAFINLDGEEEDQAEDDGEDGQNENEEGALQMALPRPMLIDPDDSEFETDDEEDDDGDTEELFEDDDMDIEDNMRDIGVGPDPFMDPIEDPAQEGQEEEGQQENARRPLNVNVGNNNNNGRNRRRRAEQDHDENWRDWDRMGEDLTWQRLLGLDGSFVFLEHVFWVISVNTIFTLAFAYFPYRLGSLLLTYLGLQSKIHYFPSIAAILTGYVMITVKVFIAHQFFGFLKVNVIYRFCGVTFLILKVFLLVLIEIGLFPVMCGVWMDICTLPLFSATLQQRISTFSSFPIMALFLHWTVGMVYVFYSASFVLLLREILRPGILWFMRNLNDPDFNPIQEMIDQPFPRHLRRLVTSVTLFFTTILLIFYIPISLISKFMPSLLPYNVKMSADTPFSELSIELLILQIILPSILEHAQVRTYIKQGVRLWCQLVGRLLQLETFLLSDNHQDNEEDGVPPPPAPPPAAGGLAAEHQALILMREPPAFEPFTKPPMFQLRVVALLLLMALTTMVSSVLVFVLPAYIGRTTIFLATKQTNVHEIYSLTLGLYLCWVLLKILTTFGNVFQQGFDIVQDAVAKYAQLAVRLAMVLLPVVFVIPYLMGTYFQLVVLSPLRLNANQTALHFPYQEWALGVLQMKIFVVFVMMGPDWWLKRQLEAIQQDGMDQFHATTILVRLLLPVVLYLGTLIAFPVLLAALYAYSFNASPEQEMLFLRYMYPTILTIVSAVVFLQWQMAALTEFVNRIKNEKYLVGTQLVNYEREERTNK